MKIDKKAVMGVLLVMGMISIACYFPQVMTQDQVVATEAQKVLSQILQQTEAAKAAATYTPYPTYTPMPTYTPQPVNNYPPHYEPYRPSDSGGWFHRRCNQAIFISENFPDYTRFNEGDTFTKTWVLKNTGDCTWNSDYDLVFTGGNSLYGDTSIPLSENVHPGEIVELSVDLTAPSRDGIYKGYWGLRSDDGDVFANFWVTIKVH